MRIKNLENYGDNGYEWIVIDAIGTETRYRTNRGGDGLWCTSLPVNPLHAPQQVRGTAQFSLYGIKNVRAKIRRELSSQL